MNSREQFFTIKSVVNAQLEKRSSATKIQNYLYIMCGPFENYTESIILLCDNGKINAASVLLRSLVEAHINIIYMQIGDMKKHLAEAAYEGFRQKVSICDNFIQLLKKYPNLVSEDKNSLYHPERLKHMKEFVERGRDSILELNNIDPKYTDKRYKVDLIDKARKCDESGIIPDKPGFFEDLYTLQYRYLSPVAHLNIEGLQHFVDEHNSKIVYKDGNNIEMVQGTAISLYAALVKDLYVHQVISGEIPNEVDELLK